MAGFIDVVQIFHLKIDDTATAVERLKARALRENRLDDMSDEVIRRRLQTYYDETFQTLAFYPSDLICDIDAGRRMIDVLCDIADDSPRSRARSRVNLRRRFEGPESPGVGALARVSFLDGAARICRPLQPTAKKTFQPYIPPKAELPELTVSAVVMGSLLGIVFGASSLYLFLKVGMTVSASIPVAVLAITIFRGLSRAFGFRRATILENNVVQTAGSAGESIAFGVGATMPALMLLGYEMEWTRVMLVSVLGGLLGILMMIPLRRAFIVKQHGVLPYPEGTACAKVLIVGEQGGSNARTVFLGFGVGFLYQILMQATKFWAGEWQKAITGISGYNKAVVSLEPSPALLGVGYIIGPRIASVMVGGSFLTALCWCP